MKHLIYPLLAAAAICLAACEKPEESNVPFKLSEQSLTFGYNGGETSLGITSNTAWSIRSTAEDWLTVSPASGSGDATVKVTAAKNPSKEAARSARLVCSYNSLSVSIDVTQEMNPEEAVFSITPSSVAVDAKGGRFSITVISDTVPYEVTVVDDWLSLVSREGDRRTGETLLFEAQPNLTGSGRNGILSVCTDNGSCIPVSVVQDGSVTIYSRAHTGYRFTATWCGYCPYMDEAFHTVAGKRSDFRFVTLHSSAGYPLYFSAGAPLMNTYGVSGFPTGILNGWTSIDNYTSTNQTANAIISAMDTFDGDFPCITGVSAKAGIQGDSVIVEAEVTSSLDADLQVVAILMESGIVQTQTYYPPSGGSQAVTDFEHDNVARVLLSGSIFGDKTSAEAGVPVEFHWGTTLDAGWNSDNLSVWVGVLRSYESYTGAKVHRSYPNNYIDNCCIAPVK